MQITAASFSEMKYVIQNSSRYGLKNIVILFHTFEFVTFLDKACTIGRINQINIRRLLSLCEFLSENREKLSVKVISDMDGGDIKREVSPRGSLPRVPINLTLARNIQQIRKRF